MRKSKNLVREIILCVEYPAFEKAFITFIKGFFYENHIVIGFV